MPSLGAYSIQKRKTKKESVLMVKCKVVSTTLKNGKIRLQVRAGKKGTGKVLESKIIGPSTSPGFSIHVLEKKYGIWNPKGGARHYAHEK